MTREEKLAWFNKVWNSYKPRADELSRREAELQRDREAFVAETKKYIDAREAIVMRDDYSLLDALIKEECE